MKKTLAIMLALIMVLALVPSVAFAEGSAIFVSSSGNDTNDGLSATTPLATLAKAVDVASDGATIYVMNNLTMTKCARFYDKSLTITSLGETAFTVTRGDNFETLKDPARGEYNPAMIEVQTNTEGGKSAGLTLTNIIFDDAGKHEGSVFAQAVSDDGTDTFDTTNNTNCVQDAIIASNATIPSTITLGEGAVLRNFGGMSAVRITSEATLVMKSGSVIEDNPTTTRIKGDTGSVGPAGAVWLQGGSFNMESGAKIQNVDGRAVYADGGEATIGGTISGITGNSNMWQGTNGSAIHLRNNATGTLTSTALIEKISGGGSTVYTNGCDLMAENGSSIKELSQTIGIAVTGKCNVYFDGEITGMTGTSNALNLQNAEFHVTLGKNSNIHDNHVGYGTVYIQAKNGILDIYGKINNNIANDRGGAIAMANNFQYPTIVTMYDGAEICNNYSAQTGGGVMVSVGIFTMKGGTISNNLAKQMGGGVYVRRGGNFIMEGGTIVENTTAEYGGGIAYEAEDYNNGIPCVTLNGGTITGNTMSATIGKDSETGKMVVSGGVSNDISVLNKGDVFSHVNRYLYISDDATIGNKAIYFQTNAKTVTPAPGSFDIKLGNASTAAVNALKTASNDKGWSAPLATFWTQRDNAATMTVGGLTIDQTKSVYALMYKTDEAGNHTGELVVCTTTVEGNNVTLTVPGSAKGFAVALVQPTGDFGNVVITGPEKITENPSATTYEIPYKATYTMSRSFIELLKTLPQNPAGDNGTGIKPTFVVQLDNRLTAKMDANNAKFIYKFDGAGVLEPIESGIAVSDDGHTITVPCKLIDGWQSAIKDNIVMTLDGTGVLQADDFNSGGVLGTTGNIQASLPAPLGNVFIPANVCKTNMVGSDPTPQPSTDPNPTPGGGNGGGGHYYPTTTPVPVIVIPPKTGDMTVWQSILHFLGIR